LEQAGVTIFKDASANKGGVTSSSLEVLAALALTPEEFDQHMRVREGKIPEFYSKYVQMVQEKIAHNARLEVTSLPMLMIKQTHKLIINIV
jgi:glutamate dehydrogenase